MGKTKDGVIREGTEGGTTHSKILYNNIFSLSRVLFTLPQLLYILGKNTRGGLRALKVEGGRKQGHGLVPPPNPYVKS
jgi:hypothetical protein